MLIYNDGAPCRPLTARELLTLPRPCHGILNGRGRAYGKRITTVLQGEQHAPGLHEEIEVVVQWQRGNVSLVERERVICLQ